MEYEIICKWCGDKFYSNSRFSEQCPECAKINKERDKRKHANEELLKLCREIRDHNKAHDTCISYGKYISGKR